MGLLDGIRDLFGLGVETEATRAADPDDLFGMSTAYLTMEADLGFESLGSAALCFSQIDSTDFADAQTAARELVEAGDEGTIASVTRDSHGYHWVVLEDPDFEDLVVGVHAAADEFITRGYGPRLLAAVFGFTRSEVAAYWIYSFRRGSYYPFVPTGDRERDSGLEFKLGSVLDGELAVESDESYWYPLWPDPHGQHPWD